MPRRDVLRRSVILAISVVTGAATCCARSPSAPDAIRDFDDSARTGYALTLLSFEPPSMRTIDRRQGPALVRVEAEYVQPPAARSNDMWICLARDSTTFLYSSCRQTRLSASKGRAVGYAGIYYVNDAPAVRETRYVLGFLVTGDLVVGRRLHEDEMPFNRLSSQVVASRRVEHVLYWQ
jgi:hypothetical protein